MNVSNPRALALARACHRVLDDKKAGDIRVLDVSAQSSITDYLIIATATSEPHLRALRKELLIVRADVERGDAARDVVEEVAVREHRALGMPRGAGGVEQRREVVLGLLGGLKIRRSSR